MYLSKHNILTEIKGAYPPEYAIMNPLSGSFDLLAEEEYRQILAAQKGGLDALDQDRVSYLLERGYLYRSKFDEDQAIQARAYNFGQEIENSQVQLLLIPTYGCNLACTYCYQRGVGGDHALITRETADAFFAYAEKHFGKNKLKPFVTLFGGEPLANSAGQREMIAYIVGKCRELGYEIAVVTNGYDLIDYVDLLGTARVKEIQVTLDGSRDMHNRRRASANGKGTFDRIAEGLAKAVRRNMPINLRSVVDQENMDDIVELARFLDRQGWLDLGPERFKTQIGRNYELFECYAKPQHLMSQVELWAAFSRLSREHPVLRKFHRPDFKGIRHLVDTGELYMASFDTCPAAKTEWVFDLHGDIYGCTASCGRPEFKLGSFFPEEGLDEPAVEEWQRRNVLNIPECVDCRYNVICGGGCGVVAVNKNGRILSPDCRPIQEIIDLGINHYIHEIRTMSEEVYTSGCMVCGDRLEYHASAPVKAKCYYCGSEEETYAICQKGHYVCDRCHNQDVLDSVEAACLESESKDPIELVNRIFAIPDLKMHGPEYHAIVPAVLVTVSGNISGRKDPVLIKEAIRRGREVRGGICGTHGTCGAAIGTGTAFSVLNKVTPLSAEERGRANRLSAAALLEIGRFGGPRCCKRETVLALQTASRYLEGFPAVSEKYVCSQFGSNKECLKAACPFFPRGQQ